MATTADDDESFLVRLEAMSLASLRDEWRRRWGPPPDLCSKRLIRHIIAWRIQAAKHGDLTADDRRRLKSTATPTLQPLQPGSRVAREYRGVVHEVIAEGKRFRYRDRDYRSLSAIAREITGVRWNGPRFFGLRPGARHGP
jgi:hypothetical protein